MTRSGMGLRAMGMWRSQVPKILQNSLMLEPFDRATVVFTLGPRKPSQKAALPGFH